jgi:pre-mRNA-processing factor 8
MVPEESKWNFNFTGSSFAVTMNYRLKIDRPRDFYDELHRPTHFLTFTDIEQAATAEAMGEQDVFA